VLGEKLPVPPKGVPILPEQPPEGLTERQLIEKHSSDANCAACHRRIDPPGFALESFDVMGGWRDRYRAVSADAKPQPGIGFSGQRFSFHYALPVDPAGALTSGAAFRNVREFKKLLVEREEQTVARNLVRQLVIYSTGAPAGFAGRPQVDKILADSRASGHGVRSLVHGIVQSELFQIK
jgi:hypothetical protein